MNGALLMMAAAAAQVPACPPVAVLSRSKPVALRIDRTVPLLLRQWKVTTASTDEIASTSYFVVDGVPTRFHVVRPAGPGTTRLFAICAAPWGEMLCARDFYQSKGSDPAPRVFVRQQGERTLLVVRYQEGARRRYEGMVLDQLSGLRKVCG